MREDVEAFRLKCPGDPGSGIRRVGERRVERVPVRRRELLPEHAYRAPGTLTDAAVLLERSSETHDAYLLTGLRRRNDHVTRGEGRYVGSGRFPRSPSFPASNEST